MAAPGQFILDLTTTAVRHPLWLARACAKQLLWVRAAATATHRYGLRTCRHDQLDERLARLEVRVGGAADVDYAKALILARFCRLLEPARVLEIGTYLGGMTWHLAANTPPSCRIWTLDLPRERLADVAGGMIGSDVSLADIDDEQVGREWRRRPGADRITQLWGDSRQFDFSGLGPFELIYVDGSHAEPWVEADTANAFKLLAPTGAVLWDDCYWRDVQRVLARYSATRPIYLFEDRQTAGYLQIDGVPVSVPPP